MMQPAFQVGWIVEAVPGWLGPALFCSGLLLLMVSLIYEITSTSSIFQYPVVASIGFPVLMVGSLAGLYVTQGWLFVIVTTFVGRWIEGVAAIRLYQRVVSFLGSSGRVGSGTGIDVWDRIAFHAAIMFVPLLGLWVAIALIVYGPVFGSLTFDLRLVWTGVTLTTALLGLTRKLRTLNDVVAWPILAGIVITVASTEIYNLQLRADVLAFAFGGIGYFVGYWVAVYRVLSNSL